MTDAWPYPPPAPATGAWYDADATHAAVCASLRIADTGDIDDAAIRALIPAAAELVDAYVDRLDAFTAPPPAPVQAALELAVIGLYRARRGPFDTYTDATPARYRAVHVLGDNVALLLPYKQRRGVA